MKVLVTVEITKGFEAWSNMACELQPVAAEYGIRTLWAGSDPEETRVYAVTEATDPENMRAFMARDDVAKKRTDAGARVETTEIISIIGKHWDFNV